MQRRQPGFTLIELLVVLVIMAVILALIGLNPSFDPADGVRDEARRLALLMQTAQEEAVLQGTLVAVTLGTDGYEFGIHNPRNDRLETLAGDDLLRRRALEPPVEIMSVDIDGRPAEREPVIMFYPDGLIEVFSIRLASDGIYWYVIGNERGEIRARATEAPEPS